MYFIKSIMPNVLINNCFKILYFPVKKTSPPKYNWLQPITASFSRSKIIINVNFSTLLLKRARYFSPRNRRKKQDIHDCLPPHFTTVYSHPYMKKNISFCFITIVIPDSKATSFFQNLNHHQLD